MDSRPVHDHAALKGCATTARDPLWYKDAVIYQLHVKTFFDGNGDGVGDFTGLIGKLDYLVDLGVTCLWLLPFYVSPLRDDGYDIAHYERIHPAYGTLADFDRFLEAAHDRGLRVITELVLNHTSDQHPWFQAARRAPAGSSKRAFYVWSESDRRYAAARVIFSDAESSNWTWDGEAQEFYWHRFYHHQPDLNFDHPHVRRAVLKVVRFWLDRGVDGLRLDAVPHLFEREGTSCENLPETHAFVQALRADVDQRYADRLLLAEANLPYADLRPYFGNGDECHMAFHVPLMARVFQAFEQEHAAPIVDCVRETQNIPDACQWALFLRNHDELTLSPLTAAEREPLFQAYAADPRTRLNRGIRRRLAPLLGHDAARLELALGLLLSLPGTPILYYGDEIGMGDDVALPDRDGLRTPMQWTGGAAGGFSTATAAQLIARPLEGGKGGYRTVNVDAQSREPGSLLDRTRRLLAIRRQCRVFSRGLIEFLSSGNPRVLAFVRRLEGDATVLVAANLSARAQPARIALPADLTGAILTNLDERGAQGVSPAAADVPGEYSVALPAHSCCWMAASRAWDADVAAGGTTGRYAVLS